MMCINYLNKLSRDTIAKYGMDSDEYKEFKQFYNEVFDLVEFRRKNEQ